MCVFKRILRKRNLELDGFFYKKDITFVKNCRCKLRIKISDDPLSDHLALVRRLVPGFFLLF